MKLAKGTTCIACTSPLWALESQGLVYCRFKPCKRYGLVTVITRETPEEDDQNE